MEMKSAKIRRIFAALMVALLLMLTIQPCVNASTIYMRQKKSIYIVMDDSGSMGGTPNSDANYALQTLLAMTDKNDTVKIEFLNSGNAVGKIDMTGKSNKMIADVKKKYPSPGGGTPYTEVREAQQEIKNAASMGDETAYWLVVFTDGDFNDLDDASLNADLTAFAKQPLANGSYPNVLYITTAPTNPITTTNIMNLHSVAKGNVIDAMNEAARVISGRAYIDKPAYTQDNLQVSFDLPVPAKNIIVFTQNKLVKVANASAASPLNADENYTVSYPEAVKKMDSTVCFITEASGSSIGMGQVTLTFDKPIVRKDTTILYEPAIAIVARYYNQDGQEIAPEDMCKGDTIHVKYGLCDSETYQELPESLFGGVTYSADANGQTHNSNDFTFDVKDENVSINMNATLPDGYTFKTMLEYKVQNERRAVNFSLSNGGKFSSDYSQLKTAEGVNADFLINGKTPTPEQMKEFRIKVKGENLFVSNFSIEKDKQNGRFVIHPKPGLLNVLTPKQKSYEVVLIDKKSGNKYTAVMQVDIPGERPWLPLLMFILGVLLIVYFIWVFASKAYFPRGKCFILYKNNPPIFIDDHPYREPPITFGQLMWREFRQNPLAYIWRRKVQLLPNQAVSVRLSGFPQGKFGGVTFAAVKNSDDIRVYDPTLASDPNDVFGMGLYTSSYKLYDSDFMTIIPFDDQIVVQHNKKSTYTLSCNESLAHTERGDLSSYTLYLQYVDKADLN